MRKRTTAAVMLAALVLTGCTAPRPDVAFYTGRTQVTASPVGWCQGSVAAGFTGCTTTKTNLVALTLAKGAPLLVEVPTDVADVPWQVYVRYQDATGSLQEAFSGLFTDDRASYVVRAPDSADQLVYVEVQALPVPVAATSGTGVAFAYTRTWAATITPAD